MLNTFNPNHITLTFTDGAIKHLQSSLNKDSAALGIHMGTRKAGCSGYVYVTDLLHTTDDTLIKAQTNANFAVYVDPGSVGYLNALTVDVEQKTLGQKLLIYHNPNEAARCGCGESFMPKNQAAKE
jgi:iron-sulfur cluster assembly protein